MAEARGRRPTADDQSRLLDEVERLRTALEAAQSENTQLAQDREHLLRRATQTSRQFQEANEAFGNSAEQPTGADKDGKTEEARVAFEDLHVLAEELEVANHALRGSNRLLDSRVEERTRDLEAANAALKESELRFRTLVEGMPQLVWRALDGGFLTWVSPQWCAYTGLSQEESFGDGWQQALHPDDRDDARRAWRSAHLGRPLDMEGRILNASEGRYRHFRTRASPVLNEDGQVIEWLGTSTEVDDILRLHSQKSVLIAELQHRVRNVLAVVRSVFNRTMDAGGEPEDIAQHFVGRLDALARTQVVVARSLTGEVDLESLIREELLSVGVDDGPDLSLSGPDVALSPKMAEGLGLAVHELTTNALKYGALKVPGGKLSIRWVSNLDYGDAPYLHLIWEEQGVPAVSINPSREGFGRELIEEALPYRLGAKTNLEFRGGGVRCTITLPLSEEGKRT